jgi:tetratricopeptide (TPR) repeat protein
LQEARDDAREAVRLAPWIPSIQSTLGAVLIETGEVRIGLRHLAEASAHHEDARGAADTLAHQAIGHHRLGEHEVALSLLQQAEQLAPDLHIVRKARAELQQGHQSTGSGLA